MRTATLHLPPTYSPESGAFEDCNFDLALFKWGCLTLLKASKRLGIDDPLIPRWKQVAEKLVDFPADEHGFRLGGDRTSSPDHRHFSHLLMIYPLYLVNIEQEGTREVLQASYDRAHAVTGLPAMVQSHVGPIGAALGQGDTALDGLKRLQGDLHAERLVALRWQPLHRIDARDGQHRSEHAHPELERSGQGRAGPIRIFPALPSAWKDVEFRDLRAEGAFLVSAKRSAGKTEWVRIKSLAGEPCRVRPGLAGEIRPRGDQAFQLQEISPGIYQINLKRGEEVLLCPGTEVCSCPSSHRLRVRSETNESITRTKHLLNVINQSICAMSILLATSHLAGSMARRSSPHLPVMQSPNRV